MTLVIPQVCVTFCLCPKAEDIVFLNVPDITLCKIL